MAETTNGSPGRTAWRFVLGSALLGVEALYRFTDGPQGRTERDGSPVTWTSVRPRTVLIGALLRGVDLAERHVEPRIREGKERAAEAIDRLGRRYFGPQWTRGVGHLRRRMSLELLALELAGRHEEERSRDVAARAIFAMADAVVHRVAESTRVREVIIEQSASLTTEVTDAVQSRAADLDERLERRIRTFLRQPRHAGADGFVPGDGKGT